MRASHKNLYVETVAGKPTNQDLYLEDVRGLSAEAVTTLSHGYTTGLPQLSSFAIKQIDEVPTSFTGDQKQLHLLFAKLVRIPSESPGSVHRAVERRLVLDDGIFLASYPLVLGSHAVNSTTNGYFGGLLRLWNTLPFPTEHGESLVYPSDCIVCLHGKRSCMYEPWVLIDLGFWTHFVTHRAGYLGCAALTHGAESAQLGGGGLLMCLNTDFHMLHGCTMMQQCLLDVSFAEYCPFQFFFAIMVFLCCN